MKWGEEIEEIIYQDRPERVIEFKANKPVLTYALIAINILVWGFLSLLSLKSGKSYNELLNVFGAKINSNILAGEYWRLATPIFLHANIVHLLINCYSLYAVGVTVERVFGHARFAFIYFLAGIMGNILSLMFSLNSAVGASGAIFGLLGALLFFGLEKPALFKMYFGYSVITTIIINLGYGISRSGIDNFGHIGGLVGGFLVTGTVKAPSFVKWYLNRFLYLVLTLALAVSGLYYGLNNGNNKALLMINKMYQYDNSQNWSDTEKIAEEILSSNPRKKDIKMDVLWTLSKAEVMSGKYDQALEHALILAQLSPPDGHYLLGVIYYDMQQYDHSKVELLKAKELNAKYGNIEDLLNNIEKVQKSG